jgi:hypothetical protein
VDRLRSKLPFVARVSVPDTVRGAELEIAFGAKDPDALEQIERSFAQFTIAAATGMFAGDAAPPTESLFRVDRQERRELEIRHRCTVRGIDRGAFRVLLNVAAEISRRGEPLETVTIWSGTTVREDSDLGEILGRRYPGRAKRVPFELELREFFYENREPVIRMEFPRQPSDEEFERIKAMMEAWDHIVMFGGYLDFDDREGDILPEPGEFFLAEPMVIEHQIYAYQGPEESFNAVINMAVRLHESGSRLSVLEIE